MNRAGIQKKKRGFRREAPFLCVPGGSLRRPAKLQYVLYDFFQLQLFVLFFDLFRGGRDILFNQGTHRILILRQIRRLQRAENPLL